MLKFWLAAHLVLVVFVIGPLMYAAKTAGRGVRHGDGSATASAARLLRIYAYLSVLVVAAGMAEMAQKVTTQFGQFGWYAYVNHPSIGTPRLCHVPCLGYSFQLPARAHVAEFGDTWIWLSLVLWAVATAVVLGFIVPTLNRATKLIEAEDSVVGLTMRVAVAGGVVGAIFFAIVVLMVYKPGS